MCVCGQKEFCKFGFCLPKKWKAGGHAEVSALCGQFLYLDRARSSCWFQRAPTRKFADFVLLAPGRRRTHMSKIHFCQFQVVFITNPEKAPPDCLPKPVWIHSGFASHARKPDPTCENAKSCKMFCPGNPAKYFIHFHNWGIKVRPRFVGAAEFHSTPSSVP